MPTKNPILIVHGWSDNADSFEPLREYLAKTLKRPVANIRLADWISMDDDVTFDDVVEAMHRACQQHLKKIDQPRSIDFVVHSTGSLVVRDWMTRYFTPDQNPVHRFVMLAPANFGSPLAHQGRSWSARAVKGWSHGFETGRQLLHGLELASPYTWGLAERDLLTTASGKRWYGNGRVLATCLTGSEPYTGIAGAFSQEGSDGTVRIANANPRVTRMTLDLRNGPHHAVFGKPQTPMAKHIAFSVMAEEDHSSIKFEHRKTPRNPETPRLVADALRQTDATWADWVQSVDATHQTQAALVRGKSDDGIWEKDHYHGYQDMVVRVVNDREPTQPVDDYVLEFGPDIARGRFTRQFQRKVVSNVHAHGQAPSCRSFYVNTHELADLLEDHKRAIANRNGLSLGLTASPICQLTNRGNLRSDSPPVGYQPMTVQMRSSQDPVHISAENWAQIFQPDRTVLFEIQIPRFVHDSVFKIKPLKK